jgi:uncharacterized OB-fold protein
VTPRGVLPPDLVQLHPNPWTAPFWEAAAAHRLVLPRCAACAAYRFPPAPFCWRCRSQETEWVDHDGRGHVYSFTVIRHALSPVVADALPLVAAVVELDGTGGCRLVGNVVDADPETVEIGRPVAVDWYDVREATTLPVFRLLPLAG